MRAPISSKYTTSPRGNFLYSTNEKDSIIIFNVKKEKPVHIEKKHSNESLWFNYNDTHATHSTLFNNNLTLYETVNWKPIVTIKFDGPEKKPWSEFSPCGNYVIARSIGKNVPNCLKIYSLEQKKIIFTSTILSNWYFEWAKFYKNDFMAFCADTTTLVLYYYHNDKKIELTTEKPITHVSLDGDFLTLSSETQTELFDLSDLTKNRQNMNRFENFDIHVWYKK